MGGEACACCGRGLSVAAVIPLDALGLPCVALLRSVGAGGLLLFEVLSPFSEGRGLASLTISALDTGRNYGSEWGLT